MRPPQRMKSNGFEEFKHVTMRQLKKFKLSPPRQKTEPTPDKILQRVSTIQTAFSKTSDANIGLRECVLHSTLLLRKGISGNSERRR